MNAKLILMLGALGLLMAAASLSGLVRTGTETWVSIAIAILIGVLAGRMAPRRPFLHGLLAGGLCFILGLLLQAAFFDRYLSLNPSAAAQFQSLPSGISARTVVLIAAPILAVCYGLAIGLLAWIVARLTRRSPTAPA